MRNKITFENMKPLVPFKRLHTGNCFVYPEPVSDQVYMKVSGGYFGDMSVSLKNGNVYQIEPDKLVQPVCIEVTVTRAVGDCG